jgi:hypothetical protein
MARLFLLRGGWMYKNIVGPQDIYPYLPSNIRICPHISVFAPVFNFRYLRSGLKDYMSKLPGKMMPKDMHKIFVQLANIFVSNLVSKIYQTMLICTMTLESVCIIYSRCWHLNGNWLEMGVSAWYQGRYGKCHVIIF